MTADEYRARIAELLEREALARDVVMAAIQDGMHPETEQFRSFISLHQKTLNDLSALDSEFGHLA